MTFRSGRPVRVDDTDPQIQYRGNGWFKYNGSDEVRIGDHDPTYQDGLHGTYTGGSLAFTFQGSFSQLKCLSNHSFTLYLRNFLWGVRNLAARDTSLSFGIQGL